LPEWRFPADSWLHGQIAAQEARWAAVVKNRATSTPISDRIAAAASRPIPGMVISRSRWGAKRLHHRLDLGVQLRDHRVQVGDVVQVQAAHQGMMLAEAALQRPLPRFTMCNA
jgi:hypothetical protein